LISVAGSVRCCLTIVAAGACVFAGCSDDAEPKPDSAGQPKKQARVAEQEGGKPVPEALTDAGDGEAEGVARELNFPADRSLGRLKVYDEGTYSWTDLGEARGKMEVQAGPKITLVVGEAGISDLSPLSGLPPDAIDQIVLDGLTFEEGALAPLASLTGLRVLTMRGCIFPDSALAPVGSLAALEDLSLGLTPAGDEAMKLISGLPKLRILDISSTQVTDAAIEWIVKIKTLRNLDPQRSQISEEGIARILEALPDCSILVR
jgi:hypothetical protein